VGAQLSQKTPAFAVSKSFRDLWTAVGELLQMQETNVEASDLGKSMISASSTIISPERRLLGWAVTLAGAALMVGGATILVLSVL
jgi:hypothetical protein